MKRNIRNDWNVEDRQRIYDLRYRVGDEEREESGKKGEPVLKK